MDHYIYADNAATTPVSQHVIEAMMPYLQQHYGNPSSIYSIAAEARKAVENARAQVAKALGCEPVEIIFTSCGSESDNYAIKGAARWLKNRILSYAAGREFSPEIALTNEQLAVLCKVQKVKKEENSNQAMNKNDITM